MSTKPEGPWAWRLRDLRGEPGPWHTAEHQRPAVASGDNIEVHDISGLAEEIERLKERLSQEECRAGSADRRAVQYAEQTNQAEAQRDALRNACQIAQVWIRNHPHGRSSDTLRILDAAIEETP